MDIRIEAAQREDFIEMIKLADLSMPDRMNLHELKKYFELFPDLLFKAVHNDRLIGFCCAGIDMYQTTGWLLFSNVVDEYRGRGIGKSLIQVRLQALRQFRAIQQVLVTVNATNTASIRALQAAGFEWARTETEYYGPGKDRAIMRLSMVPAASRMILKLPDGAAVGH
ncbi:ribosomal-protein-alanine N-acetyltransferase RimI [Cohnella xylanilytica]|uniref:GNAT family N-acetyltransferase n=1 Tax=Cohnella xylanilytica TaxID=557555 RepID=A0A841U7H8_9BACL|nr:GNAT family N-acetyltransferase [Cohnella xylanilytica]MBB6695622.1 GNAT family N-acetyltransferase [Cohnella xylanilytica]GIO14961.1 ribosomal-protein-alanine N-acetyltransferase RimI [Cohnella xylanilytica]